MGERSGRITFEEFNRITFNSDKNIQTKKVPIQAIDLDKQESLAFDTEEDVQHWLESISDEDYARYEKRQGIFLIKDQPLIEIVGSKRRK
jgi:hypothetical protein